MTKVTQISFEEGGGSGRRRIHLREISGDSESPLETVGQDLRAARVRRGDDLATVSRSLKIRKDHLEAVEEDNFSDLPGKTYAIGFVRSYAQYLGLDVTRMVERYKQEISGRRDEHAPADPGFHIEEPRRLPYGWRIVAGIVGLALIYGVWHLVSAGYTPQPVPPAPSLAPPRPQVTASAKPETPPAPAPAAADNAVPPPAANVSPQPSPPAPPPAQSKSVIANAAPTQTAEPAPAMPAINATTGQVITQGNSRVVLRARAATRITIKGADGTTYANRDMAVGDSYSVPAVEGLSLAVANAGALDAVVDGLDLGRVGENQQVLGHVSLDPQSLVDRFNTR
jgi:cytoskeleton protein RodZ